MKVAVLIMSTNFEPSLRNVAAMKNTFIKFSNERRQAFRHEYDFYTYYYDETLEDEQIVMDDDPDYSNYHIIRIGGKETVYRTFEKTWLTYNYLLGPDMPVYDRFVRLNISAYLNIPLLDIVLESMDEYGIYANALNTFNNGNFEYLNHLYARGDFYVTSKKVVEGMLANGKQFMYDDTNLKERLSVTHVDDTLFGYAYLLFMGPKEYYNHLYTLYYNFIPFASDSPAQILKVMNNFSIATRVKTTPPGYGSGYSWDDNDYRKHDPAKIELAHSHYKNLTYDANIKVDDLLVQKEKERFTIFTMQQMMQPWQIKQVIYQVLNKAE